MKPITCPHCGDTYPDFDVAHVCSQGPLAPKLKPKMNERIRDLLAQIETDISGKWISIESAEKLIQLTVEECASVSYISNFCDAYAHASNLLYEFNIDNCRENP